MDFRRGWGRWEDWNREKSGNGPSTIQMYGMSIKFKIVKINKQI